LAVAEADHLEAELLSEPDALEELGKTLVEDGYRELHGR